jgi:endonuclease/exonuclease/phosphatase family metal-dependent hydrolase
MFVPHLLAVHLKSGCARDRLDSATEACQLLAAQARVLGQWITHQAARKAPFIVLGDLNRGGLPDGDDPFWAVLDPPAFRASASALPFANCSWGAPYRDFIDHILVGQPLAAALPAEAFFQLRYRPGDAARYLLSDHCPIGVSLNVPTGL